MEQFYSSLFSADHLVLKIIIGVFLLLYIIKERVQESSSNPPSIPPEPPATPPSVHPEPPSADSSATPPEPPPTDKENISPITNIFSTFSITSNKQLEIKVDDKMLEQLKKANPSSFFFSKVLTKFFPRKMIGDLIEKSLSGELKAGDTVRYKNGQVYVIKEGME